MHSPQSTPPSRPRNPDADGPQRVERKQSKEALFSQSLQRMEMDTQERAVREEPSALHVVITSG
jgi:hypothetical protein